MRAPHYPLRFEPIYQPRIWGGRRLGNLLTAPLPGTGPIGEAWVLSDRDDHPSRVANGPFLGRTIAELIEQAPEAMLGKFAGRFQRFPLLLKFLDAHDTLSVQVHPTDNHKHLLPAGERGKTEAWVVLEAEPDSRIYAGMKPGTTAEQLRQALTGKEVAKHLASFPPKPGDGVFLEAGTVHALGGGVVIFEIQQNSDVTFRLYDWDRVDAKTGRPRDLHIDQALACTDFNRGAIGPTTPSTEATEPVLRELLFKCEFFQLWRHRGQAAFSVGEVNAPRVLVCVEGEATFTNAGVKPSDSNLLEKPTVQGDVLLLPAALGTCLCQPSGNLTLLEIAIPE